MKEIQCVLFDMDGVVIDTEPLYDKFWKHAGDRYNTGIPDFEKVVKGTTLDNILAKYFSHLTEEEMANLIKSHDEFERDMVFEEISGSLAFVHELKNKGVKIGLVTSSAEKKMKAVNESLHFDELFDTIISASHITKSKPDPEGYLLAAKRLDAKPENCIVFEDSFAGIEAGKAAGMTVIGLYTTHPQNEIEERGIKSIPDFKGFTFDRLTDLL